MAKAPYRITEKRGNIVFLVDENSSPHSVTNNAEEVVAEVLGQYPGYRIIYRDSVNCWHELVHNGREFTGFGFGPFEKHEMPTWEP